MLDGIIVVNKPKGCTSHDVVYKVKKILGKKVGHTGTLDPNATGVLPLLLGMGTRLSHYLIEHDKKYTVTLQLGEKTDTADCEGNVIEEKEVKSKNFTKQNIEGVLQSFIGKQKQTPPMYSAIKINGKKLYEYARNNEKVELVKRDIEIYKIELLGIDIEKRQIIFTVKCSKGTYIRSLCEDIAEKLETVGYMAELQRTLVGSFDIKDAITVEELEKNKDSQQFMKEHFITIEEFFENKANINLNDRKLQLFINGVQLSYSLQDGIYRIYNEKNNFIGIGLVKNNLLKREIIVENVL